MNQVKWSPKLRTLGLIREDLWGEFFFGLRYKTFKRLPHIYFDNSKRLSRRKGINLRLKRLNLGRTVGGKVSVARRVLTRYYIGLRLKHFFRLRRLARCKLGVRGFGHRRLSYSSASSDWLLKFLEARVGSLAQKSFTTISNRSIKQRLQQGYVFLNGRPTYTPSVLSRPGDTVVLYNFSKPKQRITFEDRFQYFLNYCKGWKYKKPWSNSSVSTSVESSFDVANLRKDCLRKDLKNGLHRGKILHALAPFLPRKSMPGLSVSSTGEVLFLGGPASKKKIYFPYRARTHNIF